MAALKITIVLADDEPATRAGIRTALEQTGEIDVVGEAQDGFEVQKLVEALHPRVLLLDLKMPGPYENPVDLERWVREHCPDTATLPYTGHGREALLAQLMEAGAAGYLEKNTPLEKLVERIFSVAHGSTHFDPEQVEQAQRWQDQVGNKWKSLSRREHEAALWLARGATDRGMAGVLGISERTVESHVANILKKLDLETRAQVIAWVLRHFPEEVGGNW